MSLSPNFLDEFQTKMNALAEVRRNVQQSIQFKQQFTNELKTKLGQIYQRLQTLAGLITQLKTKATTLETQITSNSSDIIGKQKQIEDLQRQMNSESQLKGDTQKKITDLENQVETYEEQIRTLTGKSSALERELQSRGDPAAHAKTIQELTQKFELEKSQLVMQVNAANTTINELKQRLQQIEQNQNQNQGQVQTLQAQINKLEQDNKQLIDKLMVAIQAIDGATNDLRSLMDSVPNAQTKQEVDQLLGQISSQIETSISSLQNTPPPTPNPNQGSSNSGSGFLSTFGNVFRGPTKPPRNPLASFNRTGLPAGVSGSQNTNSLISGPGLGQGFTQGPDLGRQSLVNNTINPIALQNLPKPINTDLIAIPGRPTPTTLGELKTMLRLKSTQVGKPRFGGDNKYQKVLNLIDQQPNINEILSLLSKNGIVFKNNTLMGGKKIKSTKKNKKQKGGFTYKKKFRRSSITSNSRYRKSSRTNRRSSR